MGWTRSALAADAAVINPADTAWVLYSAAMVMLMLPGLALFYGGMVQRKNVLSSLMHSFGPLGILGLLWIIVGYSLSFTGGNWFIGGLSQFMLMGTTVIRLRHNPDIRLCDVSGNVRNNNTGIDQRRHSRAYDV